ncbi:MAG: YceI family protein [Ferruginibacter sp.]
MKRISFISILLLLTSNLFAQKAYTKNGNITFFSKSPLENIEAKNNQVMSVLNSQTGEIQFSVIIKAFHFKKALMEEHFNENYMESKKFPKAIFKGIITDVAKVNFSKDGSYPVVSSGDFTLHGITKKITTPGVITIKNGIASASSKFKVKLKDYGITVPKLVKDNIAENIDISVACTYDQKL